MKQYRKVSHTVSRLSCYAVLVTKFRHQVLIGDVQKRCRELIIQVCGAEEIEILKRACSFSKKKQAMQLQSLHTKPNMLPDNHASKVSKILFERSEFILD